MIFVVIQKYEFTSNKAEFYLGTFHDFDVVHKFFGQESELLEKNVSPFRHEKNGGSLPNRVWQNDDVLVYGYEPR